MYLKLEWGVCLCRGNEKAAKSDTGLDGLFPGPFCSLGGSVRENQEQGTCSEVRDWTLRTW